MIPGPLLTAHIILDPETARRRLVALRIADPLMWRAIVREALDVAVADGAGKPEAAQLLGVGRRTLYDWIDGDAELRAHAASPSSTPTARVLRGLWRSKGARS